MLLPTVLRRFFLTGLLVASAALQAAPTEIELILDASGSMWNKLEDGRYRIDAAKQVLTEFIAQAPNDPELRIGLRIYGAKVPFSKPGACEDSVLVAPIGPLDRAALSKAVRETRAVGATPLAYSLGLAAQDFRGRGRKQVIVCTDGEESCGGDVAAALKTLRELGADVDVRFIGIGLPAAAAARLGKLAPIENVNSAKRLAEALRTATRTTVAPPAPVKSDSGAKAPPATTTGTVTARVVREGRPVVGPEVRVTFKADLSDAAPIELRAQGQEFGGQLPAGSYTATVQPGGRQFAALAVFPQGRHTFTFDLTEPPKVTVTTDKTSAPAGTTVTATFRGARDGSRGYLIVAPVGSPDREQPYYVGVEGPNGSVELNLPQGPGEVEVRYATPLGEGSDEVVAGRSAPIKVLPISVRLDVPATYSAASTLKLRWQGPNRPGDWIGIVPRGGGFGDHLAYAYTEPGVQEAELQTPDAGEYDVVYANDYASQIVARQALKLVPLAIELKAPATAMAGGDVPVEWTGPGGRGHFLAIVKSTAGAYEFENYEPLDTEHKLLLVAPDAAGDYEIRYISDHTRTVLARRPLRLTAASATLEAPATARPEQKFPVKATGRLAKSDLIGLFRAGAPEDGDPVDYHSLESGPAGELSANEAGSYELRYYSTRSRRILARRPITIR